MDLVARPESLE
jgi:hypothetical protein